MFILFNKSLTNLFSKRINGSTLYMVLGIDTPTNRNHST